MKRAVLFVVVLAAGFAAGVFYMRHGAPPAASEAAHPTEKEATPAQLTRDTNGNVTITLAAKNLQELGLAVTNATALRLPAERKGYGKVLDPAPLAALMLELATAEAAYRSSSNELVRLKTLEGQGNASARSLQAAEASTQRDRAAIQSCKDRLLLNWGPAVAGQKDLPGFLQALSRLEAALIRIDVPLGDSLPVTPVNARLATLAGQSAEAEFLGQAPTVDPQLQGQGLLFLLKSNALHLSAGQSLVGFLRLPGEPVAGVVIPGTAVVRNEGEAWIYVQKGGSNTFTRVSIDLDRPVEAGWFVTKALGADERLVVSGAQQLLSFELKGAGAEE